MRLVEPLLNREPRLLHRGIVRVRRNADEIADDDNRPAERQSERGSVPGIELDPPARHHRGRGDGAAESFASVTMPNPATRARFGTSAVIATETPDSSWRRSSRMAGKPPL